MEAKMPMYDSGLTDFLTWWMDHSDDVFRFWVYRRMFTPYEVDAKFIDETIYEDEQGSFGKIEEAVQLPDGDILLGFRLIDGDNDIEFWDKPNHRYIEYHKLSEVKIDWYEKDNIIFHGGTLDDEEVMCDSCSVIDGGDNE